MTCEKAAYPSRKATEAHIRKRLRDNPTLYLRPYLCPKCGHWHMTHREDRFPRNTRKQEAA